ncbi:LEAF RUST 10 DISEASE-RESISTANCE LOCUS RECEPTOR-LIKE PROTEIN KINASE-like 2.3 isoform X2 [Setaria italica]|uniref:LEAF RUST 10 DISEASE-RESISTANCE LOCUS RECEPTOR-LIKE PROTEIN KINASE-like 2.3 isoform X2 n=1 Tax=Setaria italica TaxID=4555 RepID=UPI0006467481|nr:LEAF RUST 10 DISEASE-RESISTANCE LOCUS RECEPTOR-LIKE PROTEIN KINASE-like 2.3 isoform X2 [Setaria italica]
MAPSLLLFLVSSVPLILAAGEEHCPTVPVACGKVNITFPFAIVPDEATETSCGLIGFQVRCSNNTPYLGYHNGLYGHQFQILDIFYNNASLLLADVHKLQDFNNSASEKCHAPTNNSSNNLGIPFSISPINQNLIFYNCTKPLSEEERWSRGLVETTCGNMTFVRVAGRSDGLGSYDSYFLEGCNSTVVPVLARYGHANASNYKELISDGFVLTWEAPLKSGGSNRKKIVSIISMTVAASLLLPCIYMLVWHGKRGKLHFFLCEKTSKSTERNIEALIVLHGSLAPKRYKYSQVTKITSSFSDKLGEGGYGSVFKGRLDDGHQVAVKFLHDSKGEGEDFVNEVMSIGRTSHVNIVSLFGFCLEGSKRALIYEYMPNGSLDKFIYSESPKAVLGWDKLYTIAIGIARGLEYLHHSCNTRIVHFDIKPQNILLDEDFHPKVADFGLAKLCHTKESKLSMTGARGTVGFIAPEVHSRTFGVVSTKSDVYSYGMMLLEMVGGRKNVKSVAQKSSEKYFPHWIYDRVRQGDGLQACEVSSENEGIAKKMSVIGLWCIQILPMHRPTIAKVLEMFERGLDDLDMPPRQNFSQILEDPCCNLNAESTSTRSGTKTQVFSEVLKMKEMSVVNSKSLHRLPTL